MNTSRIITTHKYSQKDSRQNVTPVSITVAWTCTNRKYVFQASETPSKLRPSGETMKQSLWWVL